MPAKLSIRMVPGPLWGKNLRKILPKSQWQKLRKQVIAERGLTCQTCGKIEVESKRIFAHEEWDYELTCLPAVAHLKGLVLSCWHCHAVEHFGATGNMVLSGELTQRAIEDTIDHFCRVNCADREAFHAHHREAKAEWIRLSRLEWVVDWGPFASLVVQRRRQAKTVNEDEDEDKDEDEVEDMALYEWPYFHSGEPL